MKILQYNNVKFNTLIILIFILLVKLPIFSSNALENNIDSKIKLELLNSLVLQSHKSNIDLQYLDNITITEILNLENIGNDSISTLNLWLNYTCSDIVIKDGYGVVPYEMPVKTSKEQLLKIYPRSSILPNQTQIIYVSYTLEGALLFQTNPNHYRFEFFPTINYFTENYELSVWLPRDIFPLESSDRIFPTNYVEELVGHRIIISWTQVNVSAYSDLYFYVRVEPPERTNLALWFSIFGPFLGIFIGIVITIRIMRRRERKAVKEIGTVFLNESQKILLEHIFENNGKMSQRDLSRTTDFTRSKTSRNLISLEKQGFVKRERWGRNTMIYLTKTGEKVIE